MTDAKGPLHFSAVSSRPALRSEPGPPLQNLFRRP